jgi:HD superfamily phosphohydrolase
MYRNVYFHKATRAAEVMLRLVFKRYREVLAGSKDDLEGVAEGTLPKAPPLLERAFSEDLSLHDYLQLDDFTAAEFFKACGNCGDKTLRTLGQGLINRRLFKAIDVTDFIADRSAEFAEFVHQVKNLLEAKGLNAEYFFTNDSPSDTPYKPYDPDAEHQAPQIYILTGTGEIIELSKISGIVRNLVRKYQLTRYYFPEEYRGEIEKIADETLRR